MDSARLSSAMDYSFTPEQQLFRSTMPERTFKGSRHRPYGMAMSR